MPDDSPLSVHGFAADNGGLMDINIRGKNLGGYARILSRQYLDNNAYSILGKDIMRQWFYTLNPCSIVIGQWPGAIIHATLLSPQLTWTVTEDLQLDQGNGLKVGRYKCVDSQIVLARRSSIDCESIPGPRRYPMPSWYCFV